MRSRVSRYWDAARLLAVQSRRCVSACPCLGGAWIICATIFFAACIGCGPHSDRLAVTGEVKLNGTPLDKGAIRFTSITTTNGKMYASGAVIKNGEFSIPQEKGLPPGSYRVEINSPDTKAPLVSVRLAPGQPLSPPTAPDRIPPDFNTESNHTVDVRTSEKNHFAFRVVNLKAK
jgi:hypothetical protein